MLNVNDRVRFKYLPTNEYKTGEIRRIIKVVDDCDKDNVDKLLYFVDCNPGCRMEFLSEEELELVTVEKQPLGVTPKEIWEKLRLQEITEAMERYSDKNMKVPLEWIGEYLELLKKYQ